MESVRLSLSDMQHKNLLSGKSVQVKPADIGRGDSFQFSSRNYNKLLKASHAGKGVRVAFTQEEMKHNSGGMSGGKFKINTKKLKKAAQVAKLVGDTGAQMYGYDSLVDAGVSQAQSYAAEKGYDNKVTKAAAKFARNQGDKMIDKQLEGGKVNWKRVGKTALKVGKFANNASKQLTGDSLTDLAIDYGLENTIGRVDPTGGIATDMISNQVKKKANSELDKRGSGVNPYMPKKGGSFRTGGSFKTGGSFRTSGKGARVYDDNSNYLRPDSASWNPVPPPSYAGGRCSHCGR
jgi:hypothetical protein